MNAEDLLKDIPLDTPDEQHDLQQESKRERISAIIAGGGSRQYLGRELQLSDIDKMNPQEVDKLYCRYEARLGAKTEGPKTEGPQKVKNPVRVAAGKKGAEARWSKRNAQAQQAQPESIRITKESPEQPPPRLPVTVNVYKNFFPLCVLIGAAGIGIFLISRKAEIQPETKQRPTDSFEMR